MQNKIKNIIISIGFLLIIFIAFIANIIDKDKEISISERRKLAQFPTITVSEILNGNVMDKWEKYVEDQFIAREIFRGIKSLWSTKIFAQKDNNKLFEKAYKDNIINENQLTMLKHFFEAPDETMKQFLIDNPEFIENSLNADEKTKKRAQLLVDGNLYNL